MNCWAMRSSGGQLRCVWKTVATGPSAAAPCCLPQRLVAAIMRMLVENAVNRGPAATEVSIGHT